VGVDVHRKRSQVAVVTEDGGRGWLAELDLLAASREIVTDCLAVIDALAPVIDRINGELHARARADPRVQTLTTLPGVGEFTALVMLAEIGDISRFESAG
jgi:transposase